MTVRAICLTLLLLCSAVTGEGPPPDPGHIEQLVQRMNVSWDLNAQVDAKAAYDELRKLGSAAMPAFLRAVEEGNASARMWSAAALASTKDPRAVAPMLGLLKDEHAKVRMVATYHIHVFLPRDPRVGPALGKQMADPATAVRQQAMKVIQKERPAAALPEIRKALQSEHIEVRADALRMVLAYEKKPPHVEIPKLVRGGENEHLRSAAVAILPTVAKLNATRAREIVGLVGDPEPLVVEAALSVLRDFFKEPSLSGNELRAIFEAASVAIPSAAERPEGRDRSGAHVRVQGVSVSYACAPGVQPRRRARGPKARSDRDREVVGRARGGVRAGIASPHRRRSSVVPVLDWPWGAAAIVERVSRPVNLAVSARLKTALESRSTS